MKAKSVRRGPFPYYLRPGPDVKFLKWLGTNLQKRRGGKSIAQVASAAKITSEDVKLIEAGTIHHNVGYFRQILRMGYACCLEDILAEGFEVFKNRLDEHKRRSFYRENQYSLRLPGHSLEYQSRVLIGGDPKNYVWAVPLRTLKDQPLAMDLLELAPRRKKADHQLPEVLHDGVEVVSVIFGSIEVRVEGESESSSRTLMRGDSIMYKSDRPHQIINANIVTSALLLIVRYPQHL